MLGSRAVAARVGRECLSEVAEFARRFRVEPSAVSKFDASDLDAKLACCFEALYFQGGSRARGQRSSRA